MTAVRVIIAMTVRQVLTRPRLVLMGLMTLAAPGIFFLASGDRIERSLIEPLTGLTVAHYTLAVPVVALILAASALGDERRDATLSFIVLRPISRFTIAGAKIGGAIGIAFIVNGLGAIALGAIMGLRSGVWAYVLPLLAGTLVATALYAALFVPLGYLTERATVIGLFYVFIWEFGITSWLPGLTTTSPWRTGYAAFAGLAPDVILVHESTEFALGDMLAGAGGSLTKMVVVTLIAALVTSWLLRTRDLV